MKKRVVSHFSKFISQTTTFWEFGLGFSGIRVILRGKLGLYAGVRFWRNGLWRSAVQPNKRWINKWVEEFIDRLINE